LLEGFRPDGATDIVDHDIQVGELRACELNRLLGTLIGLQVRGDGIHGALTHAAQLLGDLVHELGAVDEHQVAILVGDAVGDGEADALCSTRDDDALAEEPLSRDVGGPAGDALSYWCVHSDSAFRMVSMPCWAC